MRGLHARNLCAVFALLNFVINHAAAAVCAQGSLALELVSALNTGIGTDAATHPIAKCFNSMTVSVATDCTLTLTATGANNFIPAFWSAAQTYDQVNACPTGVSMNFSVANDATSTTGLASLLATSIYDQGMTASVAADTGLVTVTSTYLGSETVLKFRPSEITGSTAGFFGTVGAPSCSTADECAATASGCIAGHYPVAIASHTTYVCALCEPGSYSAAGDTSCTQCTAGQALAAVGATSNTCSNCGAGTFATLGSSDCRPCAPGTYNDLDTPQSSCKSCPANWYSHTYGATQCVTCSSGRPTVCGLKLVVDPVACTDGSAGSGGSFTATMTDNTLTTATGWDSGYSYPALLNPCSPVSTLVSFTVDATCAINIRALAVSTVTGGLMCSDPSNTASSVIAYYTGAQNIMTRLAASVTKSNVLKIGNKSPTQVTMSVIAATGYPIAPTATISGDLTVNGGDLAGADGGDRCPAGTTTSGTAAGNNLSCTGCDPGMACPLYATTANDTQCNAGSFSTLGQSTCTACSDATYAPTAGSDVCLACASPNIVSTDHTSCGSSDCGTGKEFNPATNVCDCTAGYRASGGGACTICDVNTYLAGPSPTSVVVSSCTACPTGQVSAAGSGTCSNCPAGQANIGRSCSRCPPGKQPASDGLSCVSCASGFYNPSSGGTAQYDTCQRCDNGKFTDATSTTCSSCSAGTYARWSSITVRIPADPTICEACPDGGYSAGGASRCTPCSGGAQASTSKDSCVVCLAGTFRVPYSVGGCVNCPPGTASKQGSVTCSNCSPGEYSGEGAGTCTPCDVDTYSTDPGSTTCVSCPDGATTLGQTGSIDCGTCPVGTHFNTTTKACDDCDPGYYQDREGQKICKKCPIGTFSDSAGSTTCNACDAGKYNSIAGSSSCRTCPGGTFSSGGKGSCSICDRGKYSLPGSTSCTRCNPGYYANKLASRTCTACPAGFKCPGIGNTGPTVCSPGSYQSKSAQTSCRLCPLKTNAQKSGAIKCSVCATANTLGTTTCPATPSRRMLLTRLNFPS